jgi:hypothetical protein
MLEYRKKKLIGWRFDHDLAPGQYRISTERREDYAFPLGIESAKKPFFAEACQRCWHLIHHLRRIAALTTGHILVG